MPNRDLVAAWKYHDGTKHSYQSIRTIPHHLDWKNQPLPFKIYPGLEPIPLPREFAPTGVPALAAIAESIPEPGAKPEGDSVPDVNRLAALFYFSAGVLKRRPYPGGEMFYRAAACTGALYEIELYLVCGDLLDLPAGAYHFGPADFALRRLRAGDYRGNLFHATAGEPAISAAPATIICTATYWRNAWKYQARTYRHFGWDNGTILANLLAMCAAMQLPARLVCGFVDAELNALLDLDSSREVAFSMVAIGRRQEALRPAAREITPLNYETIPLSKKEVDYPAMRAMHEASSLESPEEVAAWRSHKIEKQLPQVLGPLIPLAPLSESELPADSIEDVVLRRGSTRQFAPIAITLAQLSIILERATGAACADGGASPAPANHLARGIPADFLQPPGALLNDVYLIVHAVDGLRAGAYAFHRDRCALECLREGDFRKQAGYLGLEQELPAMASVAVFFLADLRHILERYGNRGYRAVQLEAGILGGKMYLAAYALRLGATGLTFYDDDVTEFFSPHAAGKSAIFLVALGKSAKSGLVIRGS